MKSCIGGKGGDRLKGLARKTEKGGETNSKTTHTFYVQL